MGYKNAICVLPDDLIMTIQQHIDGEYLYIPRKEENKKGWGELSNSRQLLDERNATLYRLVDYDSLNYYFNSTVT